jgi:hypothetical protein
VLYLLSLKKITHGIALLFLIFSPLTLADQSLVITLADNPIQITRNTSLLNAKLGVALQKGDIVETGLSNAQIEVSPDMILAFAPESKGYLVSIEKGGAVCTDVIVIKGWVKAFTKNSSAGGCIKITSPLMGVLLENGASIVQVSNDKTAMFAEDSGHTITALGERGKADAEIKVSREQYASRLAGQDIKVLPRPPKEFIAEMPMIFRDQITSTANRLKNTKVEAEFIREVEYQDIEAWLKSNIAPRSSFVNRFKPRLKDANFRKQLDVQLGQTPDWKNILHPPPPPKPKSEAASSEKSSY